MSSRLIDGVAVAALVLAAVVGTILVLVQDAPAPTKDDPEAYTKAFVLGAIDRYERDGRQATLDYYNSAESVDGEWYVFIINQGDGLTIAHHNPKYLGRDPASAWTPPAISTATTC